MSPVSSLQHAILPRSPIPSALALLVCAAGCNNTTPPAPPAAFDRPEAVSFFCSDGTNIVPLAECTPMNPEDTSTNPAISNPPEPFELFAVVTQTGTGEVAAVQVTGETGDPPGVVDTDVRIPGFTFAAVGEVPSAVVTPQNRPQFTYVLSRGSSQLHVVETSTFAGPRGAKVTLVPGPDGMPFFPPGSRPTFMELTPDERQLVITLPNLGEVWFVPIDGVTVGAPVRVPLTTDVPPPVDYTVVAPPAPYQYTCGTSAIPIEPVPPRTPVSLGSTPLPWAVAIDAENGRALVSDRALPIIHVIDLATQTELTPIDVQVPTRALVITPRVPTPSEPQLVSGNPPRDQRFVYAIDETDQSVLAVDYSDPASPSFGGVVPVSPTGVVDRLEVPLPARAIEVMTPRYREAGDLRVCTTASDVAPVQLHGVFLAVATTDGRVRIFDIFDLDAPCRGACAPDDRASTTDVVVAIGRHRPRIGVLLDAGTDNVVKVEPPPTWAVAASTVSVSNTGTVNDSRLPAMTALASCPAPLSKVFPVTSGNPLVCAVTDPWAAVSQRFEATWNGTVPFTSMNGGTFVDSVIEVRFDPCELGVIGRAEVPSSGDLASYGGDVVAITGRPPATVPSDLAETCSALVQENASGGTTPVLLPILHASSIVSDGDASTSTFAGRLEVGDPINAPFDLDTVKQCFPDDLQLEVRVNGAFLVQSSRAGFRNPVVHGAGGECTVDPARVDALERGRAFPGVLFRTPEVAFEIASAPSPEVTQPSLGMTVTDVPVPLSFDVSGNTQTTDVPSLLSTLRYNPIDERLYVIDQSNRGLIRLRLTGTSGQVETFFR